ncbi:hypothetical protein Fot_31975 [Forsythia ovata]|uniref:Uncharacterized protein n=1 Tax=Forsythia ovata TaxID=205694 RepID=A0ABD1T6Y1_9LAMI
MAQESASNAAPNHYSILEQTTSFHSKHFKPKANQFFLRNNQNSSFHQVKISPILSSSFGPSKINSFQTPISVQFKVLDDMQIPNNLIGMTKEMSSVYLENPTQEQDSCAGPMVDDTKNVQHHWRKFKTVGFPFDDLSPNEWRNMMHEMTSWCIAEQQKPGMTVDKKLHKEKLGFSYKNSENNE